MRTKLAYLLGITLLLIIINYNSYADNFYYYGNEKIDLQNIPNKYYLQTQTKIDISAISYIKDIIKESRSIVISEAITSCRYYKIYSTKSRRLSI